MTKTKASRPKWARTWEPLCPFCDRGLRIRGGSSGFFLHCDLCPMSWPMTKADEAKIQRPSDRKRPYKKKDVEAAIREIRAEIEGLPDNGSFTMGHRGHLLITIDNALVRLGFSPGYLLPACTCMPAGPGHDHSDDCAYEKARREKRRA